MAENTNEIKMQYIRQIAYPSTHLLQVQLVKFNHTGTSEFYKEGFGFMFSAIEGKQKEGGSKDDRTFDFNSKITMKLSITDVMGIAKWLENVTSQQLQMVSTDPNNDKALLKSNIFGHIYKVTNSGKSNSPSNRTNTLATKISLQKTPSVASYTGYTMNGSFPAYNRFSSPVESSFIDKITLMFSSKNNTNKSDSKSFPIAFDHTSALGFANRLMGLAKLAEYFELKRQDDYNNREGIREYTVEDQSDASE